MRLVHDAVGDQDLGPEPPDLGDGEAGPERGLAVPGRIPRGGGIGGGGGREQVVESRDWLEGVAGRVGLWAGGGVQDWVEGGEVVEVLQLHGVVVWLSVAVVEVRGVDGGLSCQEGG